MMVTSFHSYLPWPEGKNSAENENLVIQETYSDSTKTFLQASVGDGLMAAKKHQVPGIILWCFGLFVVSGYYWSTTIHQWLEFVGDWKRQSSFLFAAGSTGLFGGLVPSLIQMLSKGTSSNRPFIISNSLFWAIKGLEIELLYQWQALAFGDQVGWGTVAIKTGFDQFVYVPTIGIANVVLFYLWRDCQYSYSEFRHRLGRHWYVRRVLPVVISNWIIWVPAVVLIYCLPLALQLPVQNLILCFWVLILTFVTSRTQLSTVELETDVGD